jgi:hypothetical protein
MPSRWSCRLNQINCAVGMTGRMRRRVKFDTAAGASDCDCVESRAREKSLKSAQLVWLGAFDQRDGIIDLRAAAGLKKRKSEARTGSEADRNPSPSAPNIAKRLDAAALAR